MTEPVVDDGAEVVLPAEASLDSQIVTAKKHTTAPLTEGEKTVIAHLVDMGKDCKDIARTIGRHEQTIAKYVKRLQQANVADGRLDTYLDLHLVAAKIAAAKGFAGPAEFMLERFGVVPPKPLATPPAGTGEGKTINIAVGLGLPGSVQTVPKAELAVLDVPTSPSKDEG